LTDIFLYDTLVLLVGSGIFFELTEPQNRFRKFNRFLTNDRNWGFLFKGKDD